MGSEFYFKNYSSTVAYKSSDVINGISSTTENVYYYATADNTAQNPKSQFSYTVYSGVRQSDQVTLFVIATGAAPRFYPGSLLSVSCADPDANFTGMAIDGALYTGGLGYIKYPNAGPDSAFGSGSNAVTILNPYWTTGGLFWKPDYSSALDVKPSTVTVQYGDGYTQRMRNGLNSNGTSWSLVYTNRSDREATAINAFIQDKGGVDPFEILIPVSKLKNLPHLKYVSKEAKVQPTSYGLNTVSVTVDRVFDI